MHIILEYTCCAYRQNHLLSAKDLSYFEFVTLIHLMQFKQKKCGHCKFFYTMNLNGYPNSKINTLIVGYDTCYLAVMLEIIEHVWR